MVKEALDILLLHHSQVKVVNFFSGMMEYLYQGNSYSILLHSILVYKAFKTKLWFDSRYVARQLEGIGLSLIFDYLYIRCDTCFLLLLFFYLFFAFTFRLQGLPTNATSRLYVWIIYKGV